MHKNGKSIPILYSFRRCPFAMRARAALYFSKIDVELREVVLRNKPTEMTDVSAKGTVPVLVLENKVIEESLDIIIWALSESEKENIKKIYMPNNKKEALVIGFIQRNFSHKRRNIPVAVIKLVITHYFNCNKTAKMAKINIVPVEQWLANAKQTIKVLILYIYMTLYKPKSTWLN